jgi:hypothetical protein
MLAIILAFGWGILHRPVLISTNLDVSERRRGQSFHRTRLTSGHLTGKQHRFVAYKQRWDGFVLIEALLGIIKGLWTTMLIVWFFLALVPLNDAVRKYSIAIQADVWILKYLSSKVSDVKSEE